jgi:hypothetical protein
MVKPQPGGYLVEYLGKFHFVDKKRVCTSCQTRDCVAVGEVLNYLKAGGEKAPARIKQPSPHYAIPESCPICGGEVSHDPASSYSGQAGWVCEKYLGHFMRWRTLQTIPLMKQLNENWNNALELERDKTFFSW